MHQWLCLWIVFQFILVIIISIIVVLLLIEGSHDDRNTNVS